ncbi:hypothetical protein FRB90_001476 [Tulasnella sp. 427]|nr:hypothetical protein FRB90_001476 [Tulasnella sp. 427]
MQASRQQLTREPMPGWKDKAGRKGHPGHGQESPLDDFDLADFYRAYDSSQSEPTIEPADFICGVSGSVLHCTLAAEYDNTATTRATASTPVSTPQAPTEPVDPRLEAKRARNRAKKAKRRGYDLLHFDRKKEDVPFCDNKGRVFALLLGWPVGWEECTARANAAMEQLQADLAGCRCPPNRRGPFAAYAYGYSFGGGQPRPMAFSRTKTESNAIARFLADPDVQAVFKYICGALKTWFPKHAERYEQCLALYREWGSLNPPSDLPYPALTLNVGRWTICDPHQDSPNDLTGLCLDWILGCFDHNKGGHLILHEARKILSLEPGRVLLFSSALITHETIPIPATEWRSGVTGYAPGGLWCFAAHGMRTKEVWEAQASAEELAEEEGNGIRRWEEGLSRFLTVPQLQQYWDAR